MVMGWGAQVRQVSQGMLARASTSRAIYLRWPSRIHLTRAGGRATVVAEVEGMRPTHRAQFRVDGPFHPVVRWGKLLIVLHGVQRCQAQLQPSPMGSRAIAPHNPPDVISYRLRAHAVQLVKW